MPLLGVAEVRAALEKVAAEAAAASREIVAKSAALVEAEAKKNFEGSHAKGQPHSGGSKPNVVSGDLRRSIRHEPVEPDGFGYKTRVGPGMVYGRRVELGFTGTDSKGRHYNQPPYPYFRPAVESTAPKLELLAAEVWRRFLKT